MKYCVDVFFAIPAVVDEHFTGRSSDSFAHKLELNISLRPNKFVVNELVLLDTGRPPRVPGFLTIRKFLAQLPLQFVISTKVATDSSVQSSTWTGLARKLQRARVFDAADYSTRSGSVAEFGLSRSVAGRAHSPQVWECTRLQ